MCFDIQDREMLTAKEDIVCYKIVVVSATNRIFSFIETDNEFIIDTLNTIRGWVNKTKLSLSKDCSDLGEGYHSYHNIKDSVWWVWSILTLDCPEGTDIKLYHVIVKCTIPKGTKYLINDTQYISNKLIVQEIVPVDEVCSHIKRDVFKREEIRNSYQSREDAIKANK